MEGHVPPVPNGSGATVCAPLLAILVQFVNEGQHVSRFSNINTIRDVVTVKYV